MQGLRPLRVPQGLREAMEGCGLLWVPGSSNLCDLGQVAPPQPAYPV